MAEVATGVLHNVGNVLNSVNVTTTLLSSRLRKSKASYVGQVATLMQSHNSDLGEFMTRNPKGQRLPAYLAELSGSLAREQATALEELDGLHKNIEHIKDIVAMQQNFAKVCGVTEIVKTSELVEDALRMNASSLARHDVQVFRDFGVH